MTFVDAVLPVPLPGLFTYALPHALKEQAKAGCRVVVPFGTKKQATGLIVRLHDKQPEGITVKEVISIVDETPIILPHQLPFWEWIASYYLCSIGDVFKAAVPAKQPSKTSQRRQNKRNGIDSISSPLAPSSLQGLSELSAAQSVALEGINNAWQEHEVCLLQGVTSSGKTEIYIQLIQQAMERGQQVLYLLPEIVLTSQLTERLQRVFGDRLGVYHSKYSEKQRADVWQRQLSEQPYDIIVGVRSSVFLPFQRLGLIIVDEEHETSFKQQDPAPRYHARNVAIMLAHRSGAKTLLGTATPSLESYYNARTGKYGLVQLTERFGKVLLPEIEVVNVAELKRKKRMSGPFSPVLLAEMRQALEQGEQIILFQNRRGYAPLVECHTCGWTPRCPHCDVSMTLHKRTGNMTCHYCGYTTTIPQRCPACDGEHLRQQGFGTERIEDDIRQLFPEASIARMDLDTTRTRAAYEGIIHDFQEGKTDILVGTQMVTKGLDFERVSVVGILNADTMLKQPDFRAYERSFQMMAQVAGRAGRRQRQGRVILQTSSADLQLIHQVVRNDFDAMYNDQMLERREFRYPPFIRLINIYVKHRHIETVEALARDLALSLRALFGTRVLGPDEPPVARVQSLYIRSIILKIEPQLPIGKTKELLSEKKKELLSQKGYSSAQIYFDVDPL